MNLRFSTPSSAFVLAVKPDSDSTCMTLQTCMASWNLSFLLCKIGNVSRGASITCYLKIQGEDTTHLAQSLVVSIMSRTRWASTRIPTRLLATLGPGLSLMHLVGDSH